MNDERPSNPRRVLTITPAEPNYLPPLRVGDYQIIAGPNWQDSVTGSAGRTIKTPIGPFDVKGLVASLKDNRPELVIVVLTAFGTVVPRNLNRFDCPKILVIGDTHHGPDPLQMLLSYIEQEEFDDILCANTPHHAHWSAALGRRAVGWWPLPDVRHYPQPTVLAEARDRAPVFVGQVGRWHPRRQTSIEFLRRCGLNPRHVYAPAEIASRLYARSLVSLNFTLNGDTNARIFEVLSSGGCLVTDRLEQQGGLRSLFTEGEHFLGYDDDDELVSQVRWALSHPREAVEIARRGNEAYVAKHLPEIRVRKFWDHVNGRSDELNRLLDYEPRVAHAIKTGPVPRPALIERMRVYEWLQEQVRVRSGVRVLYLGGVDPVTVADSADLSRLHRAFAGFPDQAPQVWEKLRVLGVADQVNAVDLDAVLEGKWDLVVAGFEDLSNLDVMNRIIRLEHGRIAVVNDGQPISGARIAFLAQLGWVADRDVPWLYTRRTEPTASVPVAPELVTNTLQVRPIETGLVEAETLDIPDEQADADGLPPIVRAHQIVAGFDWGSVNAYVPAPMNGLVATGWVGSLVQGTPVDGAGRPIPSFTHSATEFVETHLRSAWRVHVWGDPAVAPWWAGRVNAVRVVTETQGPELTYGPNVTIARIPVGRDYSGSVGIGGPFDVAVLGGEDLDGCAKATLGHVRDTGLVIVENSDRQACAVAIETFAALGWRRIDFWGLLPGYLFRGCTTVLFKDERYLNPSTTPDAHESSFGPSFAQLTGQ